MYTINKFFVIGQFVSKNIKFVSEVSMNISMPLENITEKLYLGINISHKRTKYVLGKTLTDDTHIHNCYEIYFNISGDVSFLIEDRLYPVSAGDIIITRPNEFHHCIYNSDCIHDHYCLWFNTNEKITEAFGIFSQVEKGRQNLIYINKNKERIRELFKEIYEIFKKDTESCFEMAARFYSLLELIESEHTTESSRMEIPEPLEKAIKYIDENLPYKCTAEEVAQSLYISRCTLYRLFKENLGMTPARYIEMKRMAMAQEMLYNGKNVSEVCLACGYDSCSHFISVFKKSYNCTPHKYKKQLVFAR